MVASSQCALLLLLMHTFDCPDGIVGQRDDDGSLSGAALQNYFDFVVR